MAAASYQPAEAVAAEGIAPGDEEKAPNTDGWVVQFEPIVWFPAVLGDLALPGGGGKADLEHALSLDEPRVTPSGELFIRADKVIFSLSGFGYFGSESTTATEAFSLGGIDVGVGDAFDIDLDFVSVESVIAYTVWEHELDEERGADGVVMRFDLGGGARLYSVDSTLSADGETVRADETFVEPILSAKLSIDIYRDFTLDVAFTAGGFALDDKSSVSWGIVSGVQWRFIENAGVQFGFRHQYMNLEDGDGADEFEFDGSFSGIYASIVFRF